MNEVRISAGVPTLSDFASNIGSPVIIDKTTGYGYTVKDGDIVVPMGLGGTVTSVALTAPSGILGVSGSPVTGAGTIVLAWALAQGDLLYASAANTLAALAKNTTATRYLSNTGASNAPAWAQIDLTNGITGILPLANGGTNKALTAANGGIVYTDADSLEILAPTATAGKMLRSGASSAPSWSTPTFPNTAGSGSVMIGDGTNWVSSTPTYPNAAPAAGTFLRGDGTNFVTSTLTLPNAITSGGVLYGSAANVAATSAALGSTLVVLGGGAGGAPNTSANLSFSGSLLAVTGSETVSGDLAVTGGIGIGTAASSSAGLVAIRTVTNIANWASINVGTLAIATTNQANQYGEILQPIFNPQAATISTSYAISFNNQLRAQMTLSTDVANTIQLGVRAAYSIEGSSTRGSVTEGLAFDIQPPRNNAAGFVGTYTRSLGLRIGNMGTFAGSAGVAVTSGGGLIILDQSGASFNTNITLGQTNPPGSDNSIYNASTKQNRHAGPSFFGGTTAPTATVHLAAGTATASTAPLKFISGTLLTTAEAGAMEFLTDKFYGTITTGAARKEFIQGDNAITDAVNIILGTTTGTKIGTATTQKLGFWNAAPIVQPTTGVAAATFVANTSGIVNDTATWDGYTGGQVVKALRNAGLLA